MEVIPVSSMILNNKLTLNKSQKNKLERQAPFNKSERKYKEGNNRPSSVNQIS